MCARKGIGQITQFQMTVAQFGFMGYILSRPKIVGIHKVADQDLEGFVHFWRVIGHLLGIEERFNICRDSLAETKEICDEFIQEIFRPTVLKWDPVFLNMTEALTDGLWCMMPVLNKNVCLQYVYQMVRNEDVDKPVYSEVFKIRCNQGIPELQHTLYFVLY
ncbi:ER-bound oxygenase [Holotrichia oblita]|uniref:ER-bound oxygenase n=1 Tax=Holotrichia oblita TaxID=644536 RepID=A0ACB9TKS8_HOLOL|nr:ER-bound oxygenase [Holotrichia oblita]